MTPEQKTVLAIVLLFICVIGLLLSFIYFRKVVKKEQEMLNQLEEETYKYYQTLELVEDKYFPYFKSHAAGIRTSKGSIGDKDNITKLEIGKNRVFYFDRILYISNNQMHYPYTIDEIDGQQYIVIDNRIKNIELLVSFEKPSHFLVRYNIIKIGKDKYKLELVEEEKSDDSRRNENN